VGGLSRQFAVLALTLAKDTRLSPLCLEVIEGLVDELGPLARDGTVAEAVELGNVVTVVVPYTALEQIGKDFGNALAKKVLVIGNPIARRDGAASGVPPACTNWHETIEERNFTLLQICLGKRGGEKGLSAGCLKPPRFQWFRAAPFSRVYQPRVPCRAFYRVEFESWREFEPRLSPVSALSALRLVFTFPRSIERRFAHSARFCGR